MEIFIAEKEVVESLVSKEIVRLVKTKPSLVMGLATGSTFVNIYKKLCEDYESSKTDYSNVITFNLDEYLNDGFKYEQSFKYYMEENLFKYVNLERSNTHLPIVKTTVDEAIKEYNNLLSRHEIDVQLLGLGRNGHIGFNEPGSKVSTTTHLVELTHTSRMDNSVFFDGLDEVPKFAITMGVKEILQAKTIFLVAFGKKKSEIVYRALYGPQTSDCPASFLQQHHNVKVFLDLEAGELLNNISSSNIRTNHQIKFI